MKPARIILRITRGILTGREYLFEGHAHLLLGRAEDCDIRLPANYAHANISRHHCVFNIDPPTIRVRDLGSRNGTYVNGKIIGQRPLHQDPEEADLGECPTRELGDGDEVKVGHTVVRVRIEAASEMPQDMAEFMSCL